MNKDMNKLEPIYSRYEVERRQKSLESKLQEIEEQKVVKTMELHRANGDKVPDWWPTFKLGEEVIIKNYLFRIGYINDTTMVLECVGAWTPKSKDE